MRYRKEARARINTYKTRIKGIEKKAEELSVLCGVDVLFVSYSPDLKALHYWPKNPADFNGILDRYKPTTSCGGVVPSPSSNSPSQEELVSMSEKLAESCEGNFMEVDLQKHSLEKEKNDCLASAMAATALIP